MPNIKPPLKEKLNLIIAQCKTYLLQNNFTEQQLSKENISATIEDKKENMTADLQYLVVIYLAYEFRDHFKKHTDILNNLTKNEHTLAPYFKMMNIGEHQSNFLICSKKYQASFALMDILTSHLNAEFCENIQNYIDFGLAESFIKTLLPDSIMNKIKSKMVNLILGCHYMFDYMKAHYKCYQQDSSDKLVELQNKLKFILGNLAQAGPVDERSKGGYGIMVCVLLQQVDFTDMPVISANESKTNAEPNCLSLFRSLIDWERNNNIHLISAALCSAYSETKSLVTQQELRAAVCIFLSYVESYRGNEVKKNLINGLAKELKILLGKLPAIAEVSKKFSNPIDVTDEKLKDASFHGLVREMLSKLFECIKSHAEYCLKSNKTLSETGKQLNNLLGAVMKIYEKITWTHEPILVAYIEHGNQKKVQMSYPKIDSVSISAYIQKGGSIISGTSSVSSTFGDSDFPVSNETPARPNLRPTI